jgi:hypothetical protein
MGSIKNSYTILIGKSEGKRPLERPRCRWETNIKMDLRKIGLHIVDWINVAQDRGVVNTVMNPLVS